MTEIIIPFIPFVVAVAFFIRARGEQKARVAAERRAAALEREIARAAAYQREWCATLAHELRSPVAAIAGYGELFEDGTLGKLDARGADAIMRIRAIADQILELANGIDCTVSHAEGDDRAQTVPAGELMRDAVAALRLDAEARGVNLQVQESETLLRTRVADARRAFVLALGAAIKSSPGHDLVIAAEPGAAPAVVILHTRLDPLTDDPARILENTPDGEDRPLTGAGLRIGMARSIAEAAFGGRLELRATPEGCTVRLLLPRLD
jgi:signal transduction histidine kinase